MSLKAVASIFASDPYKCYSACENNFDYQDLIVTKCNHLFCRACLSEWLVRKDKEGKDRTCPLDNGILALITPDNVREKDEDPEINQTNLTEGMQYISFKLHLERFIYHIQKDLSTLKKVLASEKVMKISSCEPLKVTPKADSKKSEKDQCSTCLTSFPQMYFIIENKDSTSVGRFVHEDCLQDTKIDNKSLILNISASDMVKVAAQLPPPKALPKEPFKPPSPAKVFFVAIILPMSLWALAMNTRIYHNKSFVLFVLSIPALIIFKALNFILNGLKAVFSTKQA